MFSIDPEMTVEEALTVFFGSEHLGREAYEDAVNYAKIGPITIPFPNPSARRRIVYLHDVNHILSGYDTTYGGEGEVSAWELASGFPRHCWIGYFYAPIAFTAGLFVAPLRMWKAWKRGRKEKNSCHAPLSREQMMATKVGELRRMLSIH